VGGIADDNREDEFAVI